MHKEVFDAQMFFSQSARVRIFKDLRRKKAIIFFNSIHNWKGSLKMLHTLTFK